MTIMTISRNTRRGPLWAVLFDVVLIVICVVSAFQTGNWGYLLIATGLALLTGIWYLNPIPLNRSHRAISESRPAGKWGTDESCVVAGVVLALWGTYVAFF